MRTKPDIHQENRNFSPVYTGEIVIPDNLIKFRITGKSIIPYTSGIHERAIDKKTASWAEKGLNFIRIN